MRYNELGKTPAFAADAGAAALFFLTLAYRPPRSSYSPQALFHRAFFELPGNAISR